MFIGLKNICNGTCVWQITATLEPLVCLLLAQKTNGPLTNAFCSQALIHLQLKVSTAMRSCQSRSTEVHVNGSS